MASFWDMLGSPSPGDGYVDVAPSSGSGGIPAFLQALLGPTQAQQKAADAQNPPQPAIFNPQIMQATPQDIAAASAANPPQPAVFDPQIIEQPAPVAQQAQAPTQRPQAAPTPSVASPAALPPLQQAQGDAPYIAPGLELGADGSDPSVQQAAPTAVAAQQLQGAVQTPEDSKGLLQGFADQARGVADKLTNLSPAASQALIASGLATLAANDGSRNLGQIVGIGGAAGINNYQTNVQNQARNQLAQQKLAQDQYLKLRQQALEEAKYQNTPTVIEPGKNYTTPGRIQNNQGPVQVGGTAVKEWVDGVDAYGNKTRVGVDYSGKQVPGAVVQSQDVDAAPPTGEQSKAISDQVNSAQEAKLTHDKVNDYLAKLSPTMVDPTTGKTVSNPNFVDVRGGLAGDAQGLWTRLTGNLSDGQQLQKQIANTTTLGQLSQYKAGIGGRLTNTDVGILQKGIPVDNMDGDTIRTFLQTYGKYQQGVAEREAAKSAYLQQNRGLEPLRHDLTVGGVTYPRETTYDDFLNDKGGRPAQQGTSASGGATQSGANINPNLLAGAKAAARAGDKSAQAALQKYGVSW